jgi:hypothetical protein
MITPLVVVAVLGGCAVNHAYFGPSEKAQGVTWRGFSQAVYPVHAGGAQVGEVRVWSQGAFKRKDEGTTVQLGFEVLNSSNAPLTLDASKLRLDLLTKHGELANVPQTRVAGEPAVAPGSTSDIEVYYDLPPSDLKPGDILSYRVSWQIEAQGVAQVQLTAFLREPQYGYWGPYYYDWPYGGYGWGLYGSWGPGPWGPRGWGAPYWGWYW